MLTRLLFSGFILLTGFTSCTKQPYLFTHHVAENAGVKKILQANPEFPETSDPEAALSASVDLNPAILPANHRLTQIAFNKTATRPAAVFNPDTLRPDSVKTKPAE